MLIALAGLTIFVCIVISVTLPPRCSKSSYFAIADALVVSGCSVDD
jgi:hypothetical protein